MCVLMMLQSLQQGTPGEHGALDPRREFAHAAKRFQIVIFLRRHGLRMTGFDQFGELFRHLPDLCRRIVPPSP